MAVFTPLEFDEIANFVAGYDIGLLLNAEPVASGVENTTYRLQTQNGTYILTLYEGRTPEQDLPYIFDFMAHLHSKDIPVAHILQPVIGARIGRIKDKSAILQSLIAGRDVAETDIAPHHTGQAGELLAAMHLASHGYAQLRPNRMGYTAWQELQDETMMLADTVEAGLSDLIIGAMHKITPIFSQPYAPVFPQGAVHGDFFPDNVFFVDGKTLSGVIDFNFACTEAYLYDLALAYNAWCFDAEGRFLKDHALAFLNGYDVFRPLNEDEAAHFSLFCAAAALRILSTRLYDWLNKPADALVTAKDPRQYAAILRYHISR